MSLSSSLVTSLLNGANSISAWSDWSARRLLKFNLSKCKLVHLRHNMDTKYYIAQSNQKWDIQSLQQEKDLRKSFDIFRSSRVISAHGSASKARQVLGMVRWQFEELDMQSFLIIYKGFVRTHLVISMPYKPGHCIFAGISTAWKWFKEEQPRWSKVFGRPFVKTVRPMLSDRCLSVCPVCL